MTPNSLSTFRRMIRMVSKIARSVSCLSMVNMERPSLNAVIVALSPLWEPVVNHNVRPTMYVSAFSIVALNDVVFAVLLMLPVMSISSYPWAKLHSALSAILSVHEIQPVRSVFAYWPAGHCIQRLELSSALYRPALHRTHSVLCTISWSPAIL